MEKIPPSCHAVRLQLDLDVVRGPFSAYLQKRGLSRKSVKQSLVFLGRTAVWLARRGHSLATLTRKDLQPVVRGLGRGLALGTCRDYRCELNRWLRFHGRFCPPPTRVQPWEHWLEAYAHFMEAHQGLAASTRLARRKCVRSYLAWQFGHSEAAWSDVGTEDLLRYGEVCTRRASPVWANIQLSTLRHFFRFLHMRGACAKRLDHAVPRAANFGRTFRDNFLNGKQRRALLACFERQSAQGYRDFTMALCMIDLGLRASEVARLELSDVDLGHRQLKTPAMKMGCGRLLPLPPHLTRALKTYLPLRPETPCQRFFVGQRNRAGQPITTLAVASAMNRAYRRCHFPSRWSGTHILRHSFAARLYKSGADLKRIADLLGHRSITTTHRYAQVDMEGLRSTVQPWPL